MRMILGLKPTSSNSAGLPSPPSSPIADNSPEGSRNSSRRGALNTVVGRAGQAQLGLQFQIGSRNRAVGDLSDAPLKDRLFDEDHPDHETLFRERPGCRTRSRRVGSCPPRSPLGTVKSISSHPRGRVLVSHPIGPIHIEIADCRLGTHCGTKFSARLRTGVSKEITRAPASVPDGAVLNHRSSTCDSYSSGGEQLEFD